MNAHNWAAHSRGGCLQRDALPCHKQLMGPVCFLGKRIPLASITGRELHQERGNSTAERTNSTHLRETVIKFFLDVVLVLISFPNMLIIITQDEKLNIILNFRVTQDVPFFKWNYYNNNNHFIWLNTHYVIQQENSLSHLIFSWSIWNFCYLSNSIPHNCKEVNKKFCYLKSYFR